MPVELHNMWDVKSTTGEKEDVGEDSTEEWRRLPVVERDLLTCSG